MNNLIRRPRSSLMGDLRPHIFLLLLETVSGTSLTCSLSQDTVELQGHETWCREVSVPAPPLLPRCVPLGKLLPLDGLPPDLLPMRGLKRLYDVQKR